MTTLPLLQTHLQVVPEVLKTPSAQTFGSFFSFPQNVRQLNIISLLQLNIIIYHCYIICMSELENIRNNALYDENDSRSFSRY